jgi:hypothetical protein
MTWPFGPNLKFARGLKQKFRAREKPNWGRGPLSMSCINEVGGGNDEDNVVVQSLSDMTTPLSPRESVTSRTDSCREVSRITYDEHVLS